MTTSQRLLYRWTPSAAMLAALLAGTMLHIVGGFPDYAKLQVWLGILPASQPFIDTQSVLAAIGCWRQGVDVMVPNACMGGGVYSYGPFLVHLAVFPLGPDQTIPIGYLLDISAIAALALLPPARSPRELAYRGFASIATTPLFALDRGNIDLLILILTILGCKLLPRGFARLFGYGLFALGAGLKFYPVYLGITALRERLRIVVPIAILGLIAIVSLVLRDRHILEALSHVPAGWPYFDMFGARNLPFGAEIFFFRDELPKLTIQTGLLPIAKLWLAVLLFFATAMAVRTFRVLGPAIDALAEDDALFLLAGATLIAGCFFTAQNVGYRGIFLLLTLPACAALMRRGAARLLPSAIFFLLWEEALRHLAGLFGTLGAFFWFFRECVWWWVAGCLVGIVARLTWRARAAMELRESFRSS